VKDVGHFDMDDNIIAEDVIENGVKEVKSVYLRSCLGVGDAIQNGVKETRTFNSPPIKSIEDTIQNGVKDVLGWNFNMRQDNVEDTIENGVKHTMWSNDDDEVKDVIKNGVKQVKSDKGYMNHFKQIYRAEQTIQNGVKDIGARHLRINRKVDDAIENGVKEVKTPGNGDIVSTVEWMDENNTYNVPELIDEVIQNGVKEIKHKMAESYQQKDHMVTNSIITEDINDAIENGVKEVNAAYKNPNSYHHKWTIDNVLENGVKE